MTSLQAEKDPAGGKFSLLSGKASNSTSQPEYQLSVQNTREPTGTRVVTPESEDQIPQKDNQDQDEPTQNQRLVMTGCPLQISPRFQDDIFKDGIG